MSEQNVQVVSSGVGIGNIIAAVVSYSLNHSILWAIVHCFLGWLYLIYAAIVYWLS